MCKFDQELLIKLYDSLLKQRPFSGVPDTEIAWFNGSLYGVKLAISKVGNSNE